MAPTSPGRRPSARRRREPPGRRPLPRPFSSWWGEGEVIEETYLPVPEPVAEPCLQLVRFEGGRLGLRFSHYHGRRWGRDPLVLVEDDVADLRRALAETPGIRRFLERVLGPDDERRQPLAGRAG